MNPLLRLAPLWLLLAGCASEGGSYASKHPELPPAHRQILVSGKIPNGTAVAGMTHEQVKLTMGGFPMTYDKINGQEAWIYVHRNLASQVIAPDRDSPTRTSIGQSGVAPGSDTLGASSGDVNVRTTIFFQGDLATHAENREEKVP